MNLQSFSLIIIACLVFSCSPTETKTQETVTNIDTTKVEQKPVEETEKFFSNAEEAANQVFLALKAKDFSLIKPYYSSANQKDEIISNIDEEFLKEDAQKQVTQANEEGNFDYTVEQLIEGTRKEIVSNSSRDNSIEGKETFTESLKRLKNSGIDIEKSTIKNIKYEPKKARAMKNLEFYQVTFDINYAEADYEVYMLVERYSKGVKLNHVMYTGN